MILASSAGGGYRWWSRILMFAISGIEISNTDPIRNILGASNDKLGLQMAMERKTGNILSTWLRRVPYLLLYILYPFLFSPLPSPPATLFAPPPGYSIPISISPGNATWSRSQITHRYSLSFFLDPPI